MMTYIVRISNSLEEFKDDMGEFRIGPNRRLGNLEMSNRNIVSRFDNLFKGRGGNRNSPDAYDPISNSDYRTLADVRLSPLTSLAQIEQLTRGLNNYFDFYKLLSTGLVHDKSERLIRYIGVNAEPERTYGRRFGTIIQGRN